MEERNEEGQKDEKWETSESPIARKLFDDLQNRRKINLVEIVEMKISELENDAALRSKYPDEVKRLRNDWKAFIDTFTLLGNVKKNKGAGKKQKMR